MLVTVAEDSDQFSREKSPAFNEACHIVQFPTMTTD